MVDNLTASMQSTRSRTRVLALLVDTGSGLGTLRASDTLRSTVRRTAHVACGACACCVVVQHTALAVGTARRRFTGVARWLHYMTQIVFKKEKLWVVKIPCLN